MLMWKYHAQCFIALHTPDWFRLSASLPEHGLAGTLRFHKPLRERARSHCGNCVYSSLSMVPQGP